MTAPNECCPVLEHHPTHTQAHARAHTHTHTHTLIVVIRPRTTIALNKSIDSIWKATNKRSIEKAAPASLKDAYEVWKKISLREWL